jgi:hypothetical protein
MSCQFCESPFEPKTTWQVYCSDKCRNANHAQYKRVPSIYFAVVKANKYLAVDIVKIGYTEDIPYTRLLGLQTGCPFKITDLYCFKGSRVKERAMHKQFGHLNLNNEWFQFASELSDFLLTQQITNHWDTQSSTYVCKKITVHYGSPPLCGIQKSVVKTKDKNEITCNLCKRMLQERLLRKERYTLDANSTNIFLTFLVAREIILAREISYYHTILAKQ